MVVRRIAAACALAFAALVAIATTASAREWTVPDTIDPAKRYVIFVFGQYAETRSARGDADHDGILRAIEDMGFVAVGAPGGLLANETYASRVADDVTTLLAAGVPASHITIAGHSKGGFIALLAAAKIRNPNVGYAIFGGCALAGTRYRRTYMKFVNRDADDIAGRFVVAWAEDDSLAGGCDEAMRKATATYRNVPLPAGLGQKLYMRPNPLWLDVLKEWAGG